MHCTYYCSTVLIMHLWFLSTHKATQSLRHEKKLCKIVTAAICQNFKHSVNRLQYVWLLKPQTRNSEIKTPPQMYPLHTYQNTLCFPWLFMMTREQNTPVFIQTIFCKRCYRLIFLPVSTKVPSRSNDANASRLLLDQFLNFNQKFIK